MMPKRDQVNIAVTCKYCGNDHRDLISGCSGCGAPNVDSFTQAKIAQAVTDGFVETTSNVLKDAQKTRLYLMGAALLFAVLFGIFWQKSQFPTTTTAASASNITTPTVAPGVATESPPYSEHALMLASVPAAVGVFEQKAIFASAMMDISVLHEMIHKHYLETGMFPNKLLDLKLDESSMISRNVGGLQIEDEGVIIVQLTKKIGNNMHVRLVPELIMDGQNLQWNCFSNLPSRVLTGTHCKSI